MEMDRFQLRIERFKFSIQLVNPERMKKDKMDKNDKKRQKRQLQVFNAIFVHGQSVMLSGFCP